MGLGVVDSRVLEVYGTFRVGCTVGITVGCTVGCTVGITVGFTCVSLRFFSMIRIHDNWINALR